MSFEEAQKLLYGTVLTPVNPAVHPQAVLVSGSQLPQYYAGLSEHGKELYRRLVAWQLKHGQRWQDN